MEVVEPRTVHRHISAIPAEVVVIRDDIGDMDNVRVHWTHGKHCHCSKTGVIHLMDQVVENMVVLNKVRILSVVHCDLV